MTYGISKEHQDWLDKVLKYQSDTLENFTKGYIEQTGFKPSEVELVETRDGLKTAWSFRPKKSFTPAFRQVKLVTRCGCSKIHFKPYNPDVKVIVIPMYTDSYITDRVFELDEGSLYGNDEYIVYREATNSKKIVENTK